MVFLPLPSIFVIWTNKRGIMDPRVSRRFRLIVEDLRIRDRLSRSYFLVFMLRRFLYVGSVFLLVNNQGDQIELMLIINFLMILYVGNRLFNHRLLNRIQMFEELLNSIISFHMIYFSDYCKEDKVRYIYGWSMIIITSLYYIVQQSFFFYLAFHLVKLLFIRLFRIFRLRIHRVIKNYFPRLMLYRWHYYTDEPRPEENRNEETIPSPER